MENFLFSNVCISGLGFLKKMYLCIPYFIITCINIPPGSARHAAGV